MGSNISLNGHTDFVYALAVLTDGKLASGGGDKNIKIWDNKADFKCIKTLAGHTKPIFSILCSKSGELLFSGSGDECIRIWDIKNDFNCLKVLKDDKEIGKILEISDGKIVTSNVSGFIKVWDQAKDFQCICVLKEHSSFVNGMSNLGDSLFISGSSDRSLKIWDKTEKYQCIKTINEHKAPIKSICVLPDGNIISGDDFGIINVFNPNEDYKCIKSFKPHIDEWVWCLVNVNDGKFAAGFYVHIFIIDSKNFSTVHILKPAHKHLIENMVYLEEGRLAVAYRNKTILIRNIEN